MENQEFVEIAKRALFFELEHKCPEFVLVYSEDPDELWIEAWFYIPEWNEYKLLDFIESTSWLGDAVKPKIRLKTTKGEEYDVSYFVFDLYGVYRAARLIIEDQSMPAHLHLYRC